MKKLYERSGWIEVRRKGSHCQMRKGAEMETIPLHRELKKGLERKLLKRLGEQKP